VRNVPIPLSVVSGVEIERSGNYNLNRLEETQPTLQFFSNQPADR
jgi:iron complex outermembrane receptor protein